MEEQIYIIKPWDNELPSSYSDRLGSYYASIATDEHKKDKGQFFTPQLIANFMSSFVKADNERLKILDPGCGIGILSASLAEAIILKYKNIRFIELVAFEIDLDILPYSEMSLEYLRSWLHKKNIDFTFFLCKNDFITHNSYILSGQNDAKEKYDIVISNPPYFKLKKDDKRIKVSQSIIHGQSNIYSIFLIISARLLKDNGQILLITPRSFCSGNYFRLFREIFFSLIELKTVHLFNSRKDAFKKDKVLQENLIIEGRKKNLVDSKQNDFPLKQIESQIEISSSQSAEDLPMRKVAKYDINKLINFDSFQKILHLPLNKTDEKIIKIFKNWRGSLRIYGLEISTGPVVDFRTTEKIKISKSKNVVPLFWLHNVEAMSINWPMNDGYRGKSKGQYIIADEISKSKLVRNRNYVLLRRFSTKEDNKRLIAAPYLKQFGSNKEFIGIENHLNYIYNKNNELEPDIVVGLSALFNSKIFDLYFRTFNGNINVSATELRDFPLPDFNLIIKLGKKIESAIGLKKEYDIDQLVSEVFKLKIDLSKVYG